MTCEDDASLHYLSSSIEFNRTHCPMMLRYCTSGQAVGDVITASVVCLANVVLSFHRSLEAGL